MYLCARIRDFISTYLRSHICALAPLYPATVMPTYSIATFYKFVTVPHWRELRESLLQLCQAEGLKGTILLAEEGINATVAGESQGIEELLRVVEQGFGALSVRFSTASVQPFERMKVKLKSEIVTFGHPEVKPQERVGTYVAPEDWNGLISDPEVLVIDTRNDYEVTVGTFRGAVNPKTRSFRQFADYVAQQVDPSQHPRVALFCTGGIRCEKATAYLLQRGFEQVYHLQGGILNYLETVETAESLWQGECFVFDERVAVQHGLAQGSYGMCRACGHPLSPEEMRSPAYIADVSCPYCETELQPETEAQPEIS